MTTKINFISFVIPIYNEKDNLLQLLNELKDLADSLLLPYEIIVIDDGSNDGSTDVIITLQQKIPQIITITFPHNKGQSAALAAGFEKARGDVIITMDGDLQNDPADIPKMLELYGPYDLVNGWRRNRRDTVSKRVASRFGNLIKNALTGETIRDTGCSLKIMRASLIKKIKMYQGLHRFLPALMEIEGAQVVEVPVNHRPRSHGVSKYTNWRRGVEGFHDLLAVRWMKKRHLNLSGGAHELR